MSSSIAFIALMSAKSETPVVAWPTLIGALVGGALSLCTMLLVERQRNRASGKAEQARRLAEGRLAARLVILELRDAETVLKVTLERSPFKWPPKLGFEFATDAWAAHATQLAVVLSDSQWEMVAAPYFSFRYSNLLVDVNETTAGAMLESAGNAVTELESWTKSLGG